MTVKARSLLGLMVASTSTEGRSALKAALDQEQTENNCRAVGLTDDDLEVVRIAAEVTLLSYDSWLNAVYYEARRGERKILDKAWEEATHP